MAVSAEKFEKKYGYIIEEDECETEEVNANKEIIPSINGVRFMMISTEHLRMNEYNKDLFSMDGIDEFAESIKSVGFDYANLLGVYETEKEGVYEIYSGHRRFLSAMKAGLKEIPCAVKPKASEAEIISGLIRANKNLRGEETPLQKARQIALYKEKCLAHLETGKTEQVAIDFGMGKSSIQRYECLLKLIKPLQELADYKDISHVALANAVKMSEEEQQKLYDMIMAYINTKMNGEYVVTKERIFAMIDTIKNGVEEKPKAVSTAKPSDKKVVSAVKSFRSVLKQKSIVWENPQETLKEIKELEKMIADIKLKLQDSM